MYTFVDCIDLEGDTLLLGKVVFWIIFTLFLTTATLVLVYLFWRISKADKDVLAVLSALLLVLIGYQYYDNNRIVVKRETIVLENLPPAFEGFTILQLTDLHGKNFGREQSNLTALVNLLDHDMVAITGDMETSRADFEPFLKILDGVENGELVFYINGNYDLAYNSLTGQKTQIGTLLEEHGCIMLNQPYPLVRGGHTLWLTEVMTRPYHGFDVYDGVPRNEFRSDALYEAYQEQLEHLQSWARQVNDGPDVMIGLAHIPFKQSDLESEPSQTGYLEFDLVIAGHYHGGQLRIPGYGAPFIPVASTYFYEGFFPDQRYVSGLVAGNGVQQFVSRGLGASNLPFRLFNPPEINLLTLKAQD